MKLSKEVPDELLLGAGVYDLDPNLGLIASQAGMLLNRRKTRMDSDRREKRPPPHYTDGTTKILYRLGDVLAARAISQGRTPEQANKEAQDERRGWPSFSGFMTAASPTETWPTVKVRGLPTDFFNTLAMDLGDEDLGEPVDLTQAEFVRERAGFFKENPRKWGVAPTATGKEWAAALQMATSLNEGQERGYDQALSTLFDEAKAADRKEQRELKRKREELEHTGDYQGARKALDAAPDSLYMSRFTAMFYLVMSPGVFKKALASGPHPFEMPTGGATKGEVDKWFEGLVQAKHAKEIPKARSLRVSRDLTSGRPYLVDVSGAILADAAISNIDPMDVAYAASMGAGIRILSLTSSLSMPWRDPIERQHWAGWRQHILTERVRQADEALADAQAEDLRSGPGRTLPPGTRNPL